MESELAPWNLPSRPLRLGVSAFKEKIQLQGYGSVRSADAHRHPTTMSPPARKIPAAKKAVHAAGGEGEYPQATRESKMAREMRVKGNKLTGAQRDELLNAAMGMIYGGTVAPEKAGA